MNSRIRKSLGAHLDREFSTFALETERFHVIRLASATGWLALIMAFVAFPYLGGWARQAFYVACGMSFTLSGIGLAAWIAQRLRSPNRPGKISLVPLLALAMNSLVWALLGEYYWLMFRGGFFS